MAQLTHQRSQFKNTLTQLAGIEVPLLCGAMYPCSNPELVAAVSEAGALGIVQPLSLVYVHGHDFRGGLRYIRSLTSRPFGVNILVEKTIKSYEERMRHYLEIALQEGVRFFVTALGNPRWVVEAVKAVDGVVFHDVTERRWAEKALAEGVHGLICVNDRAGGHTGPRPLEQLYQELVDFGVPLIAAGGIGDAQGFRQALEIGYDGVQMGTRFIATVECNAHPDYKRAICQATSADIVLTERLSGVPCSVIRTPTIERLGTRAGPLARWLLRGRKTKHWMRTLYALRSLRSLKRASLEGPSYRDVWQAGRSVDAIHEVVPAASVVASCRQAVPLLR